MTYTTAGDPDLRADRRDPAGARPRRRGRPRSGRAVLRSAGRRPGDSARDRAGAGGGGRPARRRSTDRRGPCAIVTAPIVIFSYANPLLRMGLERFARRAAAAGVDGVLALDLPIEEADEFRERSLAAQGLDTIFLLSPTTTDARIRRPRELGRRLSVRHLAARRDRRARPGRGRRRGAGRPRSAAHTSMPMALGFGIRGPSTSRSRPLRRRRGRRQRAGAVIAEARRRRRDLDRTGVESLRPWLDGRRGQPRGGAGDDARRSATTTSIGRRVLVRLLNERARVRSAKSAS